MNFRVVWILRWILDVFRGIFSDSIFRRIDEYPYGLSVCDGVLKIDEV